MDNPLGQACRTGGIHDIEYIFRQGILFRIRVRKSLLDLFVRDITVDCFLAGANVPVLGYFSQSRFMPIDLLGESLSAN